MDENQKVQIPYQTERFVCTVEVIPGEYTLCQYVVRSKQWNVVEFANPTFFYVKEWMKQMEEQLNTQAQEEKQEELFPIPVEDEEKGYN